MKAKITKEERSNGLAQLDSLLCLIDEGKWDYSTSKLKKEHGAYSFFTWTETHPIFSMLLFLLLMPLGFVPAILYAVLLMMMKPGREQYELHLVMLKNGRLVQTQPIEMKSNSTDELMRLHELLKAGALTQMEYDTEKKKVLNRAA